jgi:hypothetical protein
MPFTLQRSRATIDGAILGGLVGGMSGAVLGGMLWSVTPQEQSCRGRESAWRIGVGVFSVCVIAGAITGARNFSLK